MTFRFDHPTYSFHDLRLRRDPATEELIFNNRVLKALLVHNNLPASTLHTMTGDALYELVLAWYVEALATGDAFTEAERAAVGDLLFTEPVRPLVARVSAHEADQDALAAVKEESFWNDSAIDDIGRWCGHLKHVLRVATYARGEMFGPYGHLARRIAGGRGRRVLPRMLAVVARSRRAGLAASGSRRPHAIH